MNGLNDLVDEEMADIWRVFNLKVGIFKTLDRLKLCRSFVSDRSGHGSPSLVVRDRTSEDYLSPRLVLKR